MKRVSLVLVIFSAFLLVSCATMEGSWKWSQRNNTIESYENFVKSYPDSSYITLAKIRIEDLREEKAFNDAEAKNSVAAYREFIQKYPIGKFTEDARKRMTASDLEAFSKTCRIGTIQAFQGFIESYPSSKYLTIANDRVEFLRGVEHGTLESYKEFITKYPNNLFVLEAKTAFPILWLSEERKKVGVVINIVEFVSWKGVFGGGRITKEELRQKVFNELKKEVEKTGVDVLLLNNPEDVKSKNLPITLVMDYREGKGESYSSPDYGRPAGPGLGPYATQQLNKAAADNLAAVFTDILTGSPVNVSTLMTIKDTNLGYEYYSNLPNLNYKVTRIMAVKAVSGLKEEKAISPLIVALHDENPDLQEKAASALGEMTGKDFGKDPIKWQKWWEQNKPK